MKRLVALLLLPLLAAAPAQATDPEPGTPEWHARAAQNFADAHGRNADQLSNPDYMARAVSAGPECLEAFDDLCFYVDPYRRGWSGTRGESAPIEYANRYGVRISGHVWSPKLPFNDPVTGSTSSGPFPAVIVLNGGGSAEQPYWGMAQGLAESGYVVMTFDQQCEGSSDCNPATEYCDPNGSWREPQEMGLQEQGPCAGQEGQTFSDPEFELYAAGCLTQGCDQEILAHAYDVAMPRRVFGALDAVAWLLSGANPMRSLVDETRIGIAGHSFGAGAAMLAANGDPAGRFDAAVVWDGYGRLPATIAPAVPTMFHVSDGEETGGPYEFPPDPDAKTASVNGARFVQANVDTMQVALRGSTHQEWNYTPFFQAAVLGQFVASRDGERVALYYTLAWLDRFLKGAVTSHVRGDENAQRLHARARLVAGVYDGSADRSSIGQGWWDPATMANVPYTIESETTKDHLSFYYRSSYRFDGLVCTDLRLGCP